MRNCMCSRFDFIRNILGICALPPENIITDVSRGD